LGENQACLEQEGWMLESFLSSFIFSWKREKKMVMNDFRLLMGFLILRKE